MGKGWGMGACQHGLYALWAGPGARRLPSHVAVRPVEGQPEGSTAHVPCSPTRKQLAGRDSKGRHLHWYHDQHAVHAFRCVPARSPLSRDNL
jgi:hypothetical protein